MELPHILQYGFWGHPLIDLFASIHNRQKQIFCSWMPHPEALAVDALTISWEKKDHSVVRMFVLLN
jgi:phosphoribosylformylglycinamidine (FGAM) synthase-like amidotransferase family enzyme